LGGGWEAPGRGWAGDPAEGWHSLEEGVLAVEEGEEGGLTDQPMVQAGVRAGPPRGSQPGPKGIGGGPGPWDGAGILGPLQVGGIGSQDEGALLWMGPWGGRAGGCTEVLPGGERCQGGRTWPQRSSKSHYWTLY
jgi:hypothetical protein